MNKRKKLILFLLLATVVTGSLYSFFIRNNDSSERTIYEKNKNPAKEQQLANDSSQNKEMTLKTSGIYEITTTTMADSAFASTDPLIPPKNVTFTGIYISKGQTIDIPAKSTVEFTPVKLELPDNPNHFTFSKLGNYYVGSQIAPANYRLTYTVTENDDPNEPSQLQLVLSSKKDHEQAIELNSNHPSTELNLKKNTIISLKSNRFDFNLEFKKIDEPF